MLKIILLSLLTYLPTANYIVTQESVDLVEINHYHDRFGEHVFDQLIFYDWSRQYKRFNVVAWRLVKNESMYPVLKDDKYLVRWHDDGALREITCTNKSETWTLYDKELIERRFLPQDQRRDLKPVCIPERNQAAVIVGGLILVKMFVKN